MSQSIISFVRCFLIPKLFLRFTFVVVGSDVGGSGDDTGGACERGFTTCHSKPVKSEDNSQE